MRGPNKDLSLRLGQRQSGHLLEKRRLVIAQMLVASAQTLMLRGPKRLLPSRLLLSLLLMVATLSRLLVKQQAKHRVGLLTPTLLLGSQLVSLQSVRPRSVSLM